MATPGKHTSSIAAKQAWESILKKRVSGAFDEKYSRDLMGGWGWKIRETYRYENLVSPHHPSTRTIFIGHNWKKHCWQIKYLPEHSGLLCAVCTLELWPSLHKSIFEWLRGRIRRVLVMNETLVITSAALTRSSWQPLPVLCVLQSATSLVQMSGNRCANDAVMMRVESPAREFSSHVFFEKCLLEGGWYTICPAHAVTLSG